jgi:hypothetical protein
LIGAEHKNGGLTSLFSAGQIEALENFETFNSQLIEQDL